MVKSPAGDIEVPLVSVAQFLLNMAEVHGEKVALVNGITDESYTYTQYGAAVRKVASALFRRGISRGSMVAVHCSNSPEFAIIACAVMCTGATITLASTNFVSAELARQLSDSGATYLFTSEDLVNIAKDASERYGKIKEIFVVGTGQDGTPFSQLMKDDGTAFRDVDINVTEDVAVLPYSSGTTGLPKGVMLTHYNFMAMAIMLSNPRMRGPDIPEEQNVLLAMLPCYHVYGFAGGFYLALAGGTKIVFLPKFQPETFLRTIEKHKVKQLAVVPPIINFMAKSSLVAKYDLSSLERVGSGAAPLSQAQEQEFKQNVKINSVRQGYGLTETTLAVCSEAFEGQPKAGSVGEPLPGTELKVIDVTTREDLGPNERGEVLARGPQIMKGYYKKPKATAETIDADGWFHTGDIGYYDADGQFYIVDRMKELIKYKGLQVAPAELEGILLSHPSVEDCAVIGVPDDRAGELPKAFIVKKTGRTLSESQLHEYLKDQVSSYKYLRGGVEFVADIPKTPTGKILRRTLRDREKNKPSSKL